MPLLFEELRDRLKQYDEITLLELLNINAEDLVERFGDKIENKFDQLSEEEDI